MIEPIRVLQVIGIMNRGGAETMIMNLYRNIDRNKVQFDFIENSFEPAVFDDEILSYGGRIFRCPHYNGKNHFEYIHWWNTFFKEHDGEYQIIHGHLGSTAAIYLKIAKKYGLYTIAHSHNSGTDHSIKSFLYSVLSFNTRFIADYFFACSEIAGEDRFGKHVIKKNNYKVLNNAIDLNTYLFNPATRDEVRAELKLDNAFTVGNIGRFESQKNHYFLLDVFKKILDINSNSVLLLVGDGLLRTEIEAKAKSMNIINNLIFLGIRSDVNRLIQAMDVFVLPSLYEGLPVTLVEAQASGVPCVISDKVPTESILTSNLVTIKNLNDSHESWAKHICSRAGEKRTDRYKELSDKGYNIKETSKWLEDFYIEKFNK